MHGQAHCGRNAARQQRLDGQQQLAAGHAHALRLRLLELGRQQHALCRQGGAAVGFVRSRAGCGRVQDRCFVNGGSLLLILARQLGCLLTPMPSAAGLPAHLSSRRHRTGGRTRGSGAAAAAGRRRACGSRAPCTQRLKAKQTWLCMPQPGMQEGTAGLPHIMQ